VVALEEIELGETFVDRCPRCAGLWFDNAEAGEITGMRTQLEKFESIVPPSDHGEEEILCPRCEGVPLRRLTLPGDTRNHQLLRCVSCVGSWVDRGELREIEDQTLVETLTTYFFKLR
jgi:Zn-finger nucleic acid-binding protein